ncbi:MAG: O-methyltransferase [Flaviflexus sp.]|nr:O-methyltransferase [Flaviflexus sp.]
MSSDKTLSWAYAEEISEEDDPLLARARQAAEELGIRTVSPATGSLLRLLVATSGARTCVEVGTGSGLSGLYLLGASESCALTTIDVEAEAQRTAREIFGLAGIRPSRTRLIRGRSADILPRLAGNSYDLVLLDGDPGEVEGDAEEAMRILRPGGLLLVARAILGGRVADPARREPDTVSMRELIRELVDSPALTSLVPIGAGLLLVRKPV